VDIIRTSAVLTEVLHERQRQDDKFGSDRNYTEHVWLSVLTEETGEVAHAINENQLHGTTLENYRHELVQVAAVAVAAIESYDRQLAAMTALEALELSTGANGVDITP
jgi:NTP pyrophosphatase (non-canonical NTP hydrolase)